MMHLSSVVKDNPRKGLSQKIDGNTFGKLINLSGRRRFTSQRLILFAVLAAEGHDGALNTSREALLLFRQAHASLVSGGQGLPGLFCEELENAYFGADQADRKIREFIDLAERTLDAVEKGRRAVPALLNELIQHSTPMLAVLNQLTQVYEELANGHAQQVKKQLNSIMTDIESIARQARMVSFNAQIVAARAGDAGREFSVVAKVLTDITNRIDELVHQAVSHSHI